MTSQPSVPRPDVVVEDDIDAERGSELEKRYHLFLHDSDDHTYEYVIEMLGAVFGYSKEKAFAIASMIDGHGRGIVETADYETVKQHQDQIHGWGPDPRIPALQRIPIGDDRGSALGPQKPLPAPRHASPSPRPRAATPYPPSFLRRRESIQFNG